MLVAGVMSTMGAVANVALAVAVAALVDTSLDLRNDLMKWKENYFILFLH